MTGLHESTLALSVYNAIARCGTMTREQALAVLQKHWEQQLDLAEMNLGVEYLVTRKMITEADGVLAPSKLVNGAAATVIRHPADATALTYSRVQSKAQDGTRLG